MIVRLGIVASALIGPFTADCPLCYDLPLRFGSRSARDLWATEHRNLFSWHRVACASDPSLVHEQLLRKAA